MSKIIPATSMQVRTWFDKNPTLVPKGAEKSVQTNQRGRLNTEAVAVYNKHNKTQPYSEGNKATMPLSYKARNHRVVTVNLPKSEVRALAGKAGTRGPLSQRDLEFAAEVFASTR